MRKLLFVLLLGLGLALPLSAQCLGEMVPATVHDCKFTTKDAAGIPATLTGPVIKAYKANSDTTEVTTGITLTVNFDSVTGLNNLRYDLSNAFYAAGSDISFVITTGTVSGDSRVGDVVAQIHIFDGVVVSSQAGDNLNDFFENAAASTAATVDDVTAIKGRLPTALTSGRINAVLAALPAGVFNVQKNTAFSNFPVWMLSSAGVGLTVTPVCRVQKDAGGWALANDTTPTSVGRGKYVIDLTSSELNANVVSIECTGSGASVYRTNVTPQR